MKKKIAILYICTGEYKIFWKPFYESFQKYFLKNSCVDYYIFTDEEKLLYRENVNVHVNYQEMLEWPFSTLLRFDMFLRLEEEIQKYDYIFFFNANMICMDYVTEEEFLPLENKLLVMNHPGNYKRQKVVDAQFERNPKSMAYVEMGQEKIYVAGGLEGGKTEAFIEMAKELKYRIHRDLDNGIIACFHDESHLNRYIIDYPDYRLLEPSYMYPQCWTLPVRCKIYMFEKKMFMDMLKVKKSINENTSTFAIRNQYKEHAYYEIVKQLLYIRKNEYSIAFFLNRVGLRKIAIYGYKEIGEILLDELKDTNIQIKYVIDQKWRQTREGTPIISCGDVSVDMDVDCIIVACVHAFFEIYNLLTDRVKCRLLPADYVVHETYMDCVKHI